MREDDEDGRGSEKPADLMEASPDGQNSAERLGPALDYIVCNLHLTGKLANIERDTRDTAAVLELLPTAALIVLKSLEVVCINRQAKRLLADCESVGVYFGALVLEYEAAARGGAHSACVGKDGGELRRLWRAVLPAGRQHLPGRKGRAQCAGPAVEFRRPGRPPA